MAGGIAYNKASPFSVAFSLSAKDMAESTVPSQPSESPQHSTLELIKHDSTIAAPERDNAIVAPENSRANDAPQVSDPTTKLIMI